MDTEKRNGSDLQYLLQLCNPKGNIKQANQKSYNWKFCISGLRL